MAHFPGHFQALRPQGSSTLGAPTGPAPTGLQQVPIGRMVAPQGFNAGQQAQNQGAPPEIVNLINQGMTPQQAQAQFQGQQSFQNPLGANFPQQQQFGAGQAQPGIQLALPPGQVPAGPVQPQPFGQPAPLNQPQVPPTGLIGSEQALQGGLQGSLDALGRSTQGGLNLLGGAANEARGFLGQARGDVNQQFGQAVQGLQPFQQGGTGAFNIQNALAGGAGVEAQQQALANLQPVNQFLQDQGQRQIASAVGRRGFSGDTIREAARFGQGLASQSLGDQFNRLAQTSGQGLQAAGAIGSLRGQQGSLFSNLGQVGANQAFNFGSTGSSILNNLGTNQANLITGAGRDVASGRLGTGQGIASALSNSAANLATLQGQGGAGLSDILGGAGINAANLQTQFGNLSAADQQQLAVILANISTGQGSQLANIQNQPAVQTNALGQFGQLASGLGGLAQAFPQQAQAQPFQQPITTINTGNQFRGFA